MLMFKVTTRSFWAETAGGVHFGSHRRGMRTFAMAAALLCAVVSAAASPPPRQPTAEQQREVDQLTTEHRTRMQQNDHVRAITAARQLWALKQKLYGADAEEAQRDKLVLAETLDIGGNYGEALDLFHQLAETAVQQHGAESREEAAVLQRMESLLHTMQRWDELHKTYQRVLAIKKKLDGESSGAYVAELGSYATFLTSQTQYAAARQAFEQQIKLTEQLDGGKPNGNLATSLLALGRIYFETQQQTKAAAAFERALAIAEHAPGAQAFTQGAMIVAVAMTYRMGGRVDLAIPLEKRARELYTQEIARREKAKVDDVLLTTLIGSLGQLQWLTDDLAGADQLMTRAIAIDRQYGRASAWTPMLAQIKRAEGKPGEALVLLDRATADFEKRSGSKNVYSSMRADVYSDLRDYPHAQTELEEYLAQIAKGRGKSSPEYGVGLLRLALNDVRRGSIASAEPRLSEGLAAAERELTMTLKTGTESDHRLWFRRNGYQLDLAISYQLAYAAKSASAARLALTTLLRRKGRVLDAAAANIATIRAKLSPADQQLLDELAAARGRLAKRQVAGPGDDATAYAKEVAALVEHIQTLELKLSQKSAEYRALSQPIELAAIQHLIPAGTNLVEIVNYQPFEFTRQYSLKPKPVARHYLAYVLGNTGDPVAIELGPADAIDQAVEVLRKALANRKNDRVKELGRALYDLTFAKIAPQLGASTDILIAPDGTLNLVPFAALVDDHQAFLVSRYTFTYLTSGRDLLRRNVKAKAHSGSVIFADPTFETNEPSDEGTSRGSRSVDLASVTWPQLPGTRQEAEQVRKTVKKFKLYAGDEATESQLKQLHGPRILHLATHGFFLKDKPRPPSRSPDAAASPGTPRPRRKIPCCALASCWPARTSSLRETRTAS